MPMQAMGVLRCWNTTGHRPACEGVLRPGRGCVAYCCMGICVFIGNNSQKIQELKKESGVQVEYKGEIDYNHYNENKVSDEPVKNRIN